MDFLDKHTEWAKQRLVSTRMERVSGYKVTDEFGKQTEQGYLSSIVGITLKNDLNVSVVLVANLYYGKRVVNFRTFLMLGVLNSPLEKLMIG